MDNVFDWLRKNIAVILALSALIGGVIHVHDDYKRMQLIQELHERQIKELQSNQDVAFRIAANIVNRGDR